MDQTLTLSIWSRDSAANRCTLRRFRALFNHGAGPNSLYGIIETHTRRAWLLNLKFRLALTANSEELQFRHALRSAQT